MSRVSSSVLKEQVLRLLEADGPLSAREVAERLNVDQDPVRNAMQVLVFEQCIKAVDRGDPGEQHFKKVETPTYQDTLGTHAFAIRAAEVVATSRRSN